MDRTPRPRPTRASLLALAAAVVALSGCPAERDPGADLPDVDPDTAPRTTAPMPGMHMDPAGMRRHAEELDSTVVEMRSHLQYMRQAPPELWHGRMEEHVPRVSGALDTMERQMRELGMGAGVGDEEMGARMGMGGAEYRGMVREMEALRRELEELQRDSDLEVRRRMPDHLERLEGVVETMERTAAHMRGR